LSARFLRSWSVWLRRPRERRSPRSPYHPAGSCIQPASSHSSRYDGRWWLLAPMDHRQGQSRPVRTTSLPSGRLTGAGSRSSVALAPIGPKSGSLTPTVREPGRSTRTILTPNTHAGLRMDVGSRTRSRRRRTSTAERGRIRPLSSGWSVPTDQNAFGSSRATYRSRTTTRNTRLRAERGAGLLTVAGLRTCTTGSESSRCRRAGRTTAAGARTWRGRPTAGGWRPPSAQRTSISASRIVAACGSSRARAGSARASRVTRSASCLRATSATGGLGGLPPDTRSCLRGRLRREGAGGSLPCQSTANVSSASEPSRPTATCGRRDAPACSNMPVGSGAAGSCVLRHRAHGGSSGSRSREHHAATRIASSPVRPPGTGAASPPRNVMRSVLSPVKLLRFERRGPVPVRRRS
jgi:hypothetical protein